jgi:DNA polymerase (family X)
LAEVIRKGELRSIPGVGDAIADIIATLAKKGTHPSLEKLRRETPESLMSFISLPGLRVSDAVRLKDRLGTSSLEALERAARDNRIAATKGLGRALQSKVINALEIRRQGRGKRHIHRAATLLEAAKLRLERTQPRLSAITVAGDLRRGCELISDMRLVAIGLVKSLDTVQHSDVTLVVTPGETFGSALLYATGSTSHLAKLEHLARARGAMLSEKGVSRGGRTVSASTEEEIYKALDLQYIEPELREGADEIDLAARRGIPTLVRDADIRGILHSHTDLSDGVHTLQQMAKAVSERGYEYFGVADHSRSAHYAGGLSLQDIGTTPRNRAS